MRWKAERRYVCVRLSGADVVERDHAGCVSLDDAVELLLPGHVQKGWRVALMSGSAGRRKVVRLFEVEVFGRGARLKKAA